MNGVGVGDPGTVAVVGTGVIGASWAALFLAGGHDVVAHDPAPGAERRLREAVAQAWPTLRRLGLAGGASPQRLTFTADLAAAVAEARFVQESGPERIELKQRLFADLDAATPVDTVIASSSSGLTPSQLQEMCGRAPERVLVGHPFHPAHLIPLVEVVPGARTDPAAVEQAMAFYTGLGKRPIHVRQELPGHVTNRLQAALWQEAYSLVERGVVSVADVDAAICHGPGLRWALLGPLVNQHLSGGAGGLAHTLAHLGPPAEEWMKDLRPARLSPTLVAQLVSGVDDELADLDQAELVAQRDELLVALLQHKRDHRTLP
ncbi:3-hydroxyacyl-CoA dehydrogenase NAD-binding domain-containing protein [Streptacidiphilus jiangxiensis]|uniref:3-hydroxyacyl-CoA dehydrogenase n=1 Tax=Streptacidiphilus jiangxiensis TaxID=235985 RepID=A0A1H7ZD16_STRJI|nr:3-hydroxyacyl-CoA dehydrogenase NAD-binding domain-containing protein [Streptacidiphilus jiangxiensis]SEM56300.1 3-hydroxyacyl-CoA dehydrogenase [Streptacidiphilus jiangxiensis]